MLDPKTNNPRPFRYLLLSMVDELQAIGNFLYHQWFLVIVLIGLLVWAIVQFNPLPPQHVRLASGQSHSTLEVIAGRYQLALAREGIEVSLLGSRGALGNLQRLIDGEVDIALSQGGAPLSQTEGLHSLGSIGYQPLWLFLREPLGEQNFITGLVGQRVSIGLPGSGTRTIIDRMLPLLDAETLAQYQWVERDARDSIEALLSGEIDAMFLLAGIESGNAQALLQHPDVVMHDFQLAAGLTRHLDFVEVITLPKGSIQLHPPRPAQDVRMIATTTTLVVRSDLHPAIQQLLLQSSARLAQQEPDFFARDGGFPAYVDKALPLSEAAERFYAGSRLPFERFLPFWLASLIDAFWFWVIAVLAVGYPLLRLTPTYRKTVFDLVAAQRYRQLRSLQSRWLTAVNTLEQAELRQELLGLQQDILRIWVPRGRVAQYAALSNAVILFGLKMDEMVDSTRQVSEGGS